MPIRNEARTRSRSLIDKFLEPQIGNRTSGFHVVNGLGTFVHRKCSHTLEHAKKNWQKKGLFIAEDDICEAPTPYVFVLYEMDCGTLLYLMVERVCKTKLKKSLEAVHVGLSDAARSEFGYWVPFKKWQICSFSMYELVEKNGDGKSHHFAWKY